MKKSLVALAIAAALIAPAAAQPMNGPVIISEIMFNPSNSEPASEWVEIYNSGASVVDISAWYLADEDGLTGAFPTPTLINPGEAIVIIPDLTLVADFQAAWGTGYQVIAVANWSSGGGMNGLANSPSATNEVLTLVDVNGVVQDEVNFDDNGVTWPADPGDRSIFLASTALDAVSNDNGANWQLPTSGVAGAITSALTTVFFAPDVGSPGFVDTGFIPFDHDVTCLMNSSTNQADLTITVTGGTLGNTYFLATAFQNVGVAPNGWFYGIDITWDELLLEVNDPVIFNGVIFSSVSTVTIPSLAPSCPLGVNIDCVALEFDAATRLFIQNSAPKTINL